MNSLKLIFCIFLLSTTSFAQSKLILIGGGKRTTDVLTKIAEEVGPKNLLVITWASTVPQESFEALQQDFSKINFTHLTHAPTAPLNLETKQQFLQQLENTGGVYFSGGDQNRIMAILEDQPLKEALLKKYKSGFLFAGTSAGTAIMSNIMITGEGDISVINPESIKTTIGLGLINNAIIDQHFIKRQRQNRLQSLLLKHPNKTGIGIDEDTALYIRNNYKSEVMGDRQVMLIKPRKKYQKVYLFNKGQNFKLRL